MLMDDRDVAQLLPLRHDHFEKGVSILLSLYFHDTLTNAIVLFQDLVLPPERQWSQAKDTLYSHPPEQTDSFIMYIKCSLLISRIKTFNVRYKSLAFAGDPSVVPITDSNTDTGNFKASPRTSPMFLELDNLILSFKNKFPAHLKNPCADGKVDYYLYSAWNVLHL